jgi:hypothetical protein
LPPETFPATLGLRLATVKETDMSGVSTALGSIRPEGFLAIERLLSDRSATSATRLAASPADRGPPNVAD